MYDNITTVIFDMDGVLLDSENLSRKAWIELADEYGVKDVMKAFAECIGTPDSNIIRILDGYVERSRAGISGAEFRSRSLALLDRMVAKDGMPLKYYAAECLDALRKKGYKLGLASSTSMDRVVQQLTDTRLIGFFEDVMGGGMFEKGKPDPEIFLRSCERLGSAPNECIVIEDSYNGIRAAYSAGMKPIMVPDIMGPNDEMEQKAWKILPDLKHVVELL